jgi:hypothetical protein
LASTSNDGTLRIWDGVRGQQLLILKEDGGGSSWDVCFSPDGARLAAAGYASAVKLWDSASGQELLTLKGHTHAIRRVCFSPDGRRLATASWDKTVKVWNSVTGEELVTLKGHTDQVNSVYFSPDGSRLASASNDKTVMVWESVLPEHAVRRKRELVERVHALFGQPLLRADVVALMRKEAHLTESERSFAIRVAQAHHESTSWEWSDAAWQVVKNPRRGQQSYALALRQAEIAVGLDPDNGVVHRTLGVAHYRLAGYAKAVAMLTQSSRLLAGPQQHSAMPISLAFLAMAQHQLGKRDEAKATLARLREIMELRHNSRNAEAQGFLRDAEELLQSKWRSPG